MIRKFGYILDTRQKIKLMVLTVIILIGSFVELLGVAAINPIITVITDPQIIMSDEIYLRLGQILGISEVKEYILTLTIILVIIYVFKNVYSAMEYYIQYKFVYDSERELSVRMFKSYILQSYLYHTGKNVSELHRNISDDAQNCFSALLSIVQGFAEITVCFFLIIYLMITDVVSTLSVLGILVVFFGFFFLIFKRYTVRTGNKLRDALATRNKWILQAFGAIKEIKILNKENYFINRYQQSYSNFSNARRKQSFLYSLPRPIIETVCISGFLLVMGIRIYLGEDPLNFASVMAVFLAAVFRMLPSFNKISVYFGNIMLYKPSIDALCHDLEEVDKLATTEGSVGESTKFEENNIFIKSLYFKYPENEKYVLKDINLCIPRNKTIAFIGSSGAGKSTMADLIMGILSPTSGRISFGEIDIHEHLYWWHRSIGYVPQQIYLLDDTIRNNVAFGEEKVSDEMVWNALKQAHLDDFVSNHKDGLDMMVGERGVKLSGGQRQRVGIARALFFNPEIIIFDEATSALDNETEKAVMDSIEQLHGKHTLLIIAHRLTTVKNADLIYEVTDGKVVQRDREWIKQEMRRL